RHEPVSGSETLVQSVGDGLYQVRFGQASAGHLSSLIQFRHRSDAVIGSQHDESVARADLVVHVIQQFAERAVEAYRDVAHSGITGPHRGPDKMVERKTDGENVCAGVTAEALAADGALRELFDHFVAPRCGFDSAAKPNSRIRNHGAKSRRRIV